ncbi:MAG TPA: glycosyltransferase [Pyrinomonadaceae bacterium]|jgi:glycosyltransferase involved in cell wall biosynthesis|nr:glycosyltransferase [Pyrinomonadaceae bacterium]
MRKRARVLQLPVAYLPWTIGGREVYAHHLSKNLQASDWDVRVCIHQNLNTHEPTGEHEHEGVPVTVLPPLPGQEARSAVYGCAPSDVPGFEFLLKEFQPDIVHFHDFSVGANLLHLRLAEAAGARTLVTYHSPGQSCLQRSLLYRGREVCDGVISSVRCTACRLGVSGMPETIGELTAKVSLPFLRPETKNFLSRALTARAMTEQFQSAWAEMILRVDKIHIYADWVAEMMAANGVDAEKLVMLRTGGPWHKREPQPPIETTSEKLRLVYLGRCDRVKGVQVLVEAIQSLPEDYPVEVAFWGPYWDRDYGMSLREMMRGDARLLEPKIIPHADVSVALKDADICVVPSLWLETGPLVVLEAFAAGVPVIGSRLGGIAELVSDGVDGLLFTPGDATELARIIRSLAEDCDRLSALKRGVKEPRTMRDVAEEMAVVYEELLCLKTEGVATVCR